MPFGEGYQDAEARVPFGQGKTQNIPLEWASFMLGELFRTRPEQFGKLLAKAAMEAAG